MKGNPEYIEGTETAILGGGCFWCIEAAFSRCKGVREVISGYSGGKRADPSYEMVCTGVSGHAEVIEVRFEPSEISYEDILHIFFSIHDPTTLNRQGNDIGTQYRSVIFYNSAEQKMVAERVIAELSEEKIFGQAIVTEVLPLEVFYPAEEHHQNYYQKNPEQAYCQIMIAPKLAKFRQKYAKFFKD
jgi:peptide-methionine (S)-S-oxide reductase